MEFCERTGFLLFKGIKKDTSDIKEALKHNTDDLIKNNKELNNQVVKVISKDSSKNSVKSNNIITTDLTDRTLDKLANRKKPVKDRDSKGRFVSNKGDDKITAKDKVLIKEDSNKKNINIDTSRISSIANIIGEEYAESFREIYGLFSGLSGLIEAPINLYKKLFGKKDKKTRVDNTKDNTVNVSDNKKTLAKTKDIQIVKEPISNGKKSREKRDNKKRSRLDKKRNKLLASGNKNSTLLRGALRLLLSPLSMLINALGVLGSTLVGLPAMLLSGAKNLLGLKGSDRKVDTKKQTKQTIKDVKKETSTPKPKSKAKPSALGKIFKGAKGVSKVVKGAGIVSAVPGAIDLADIWTDKETKTKGKDGKLDKTAETVGGMGGAMGGTILGASIGSVVPVVGTAIGGLIGGALGYFGGSFLGDKAGDYLFEDKKAKDLSKLDKSIKAKEIRNINDAKKKLQQINSVSLMEKLQEQKEQKTKVTKNNKKDNNKKESSAATNTDTNKIIIKSDNSDVVNAIKKLGIKLDKSISENKTITKNIISHTPKRDSIRENI